MSVFEEYGCEYITDINGNNKVNISGKDRQFLKRAVGNVAMHGTRNTTPLTVFYVRCLWLKRATGCWIQMDEKPEKHPNTSLLCSSFNPNNSILPLPLFLVGNSRWRTWRILGFLPSFAFLSIFGTIWSFCKVEGIQVIDERWISLSLPEGPDTNQPIYPCWPTFFPGLANQSGHRAHEPNIW